MNPVTLTTMIILGALFQARLAWRVSRLPRRLARGSLDVSKFALRALYLACLPTQGEHHAPMTARMALQGARLAVYTETEAEAILDELERDAWWGAILEVASTPYLRD